MKKYKYVFVVLVYRNTADLKSFFASLKLEDFKVIVVNSYFDEESDKAFKCIAEENNADFITVENKGYGAGNNAGCRYAMDHYEFSYLIISNADITIENWDEKAIAEQGDKIIAPDIRTLSGKIQNPNIPYKPSKFNEDFQYWAYKGHHNRMIYFAHAVSRLKKILFYATHSSSRPASIYSPHGAFMIIPSDILSRLYPLFNEKMFLFNEERYLARLVRSNGISVAYVPKIQIKHMEDGSISLLNIKIFELSRDSYIEYYNSTRTR